MSRKITRDNMRHKDRMIDEGCASPDDPIYSEGWTLGRPLGVSSLYAKNAPSRKKTVPKKTQANKTHRYSDR